MGSWEFFLPVHDIGIAKSVCVVLTGKRITIPTIFRLHAKVGRIGILVTNSDYDSKNIDRFYFTQSTQLVQAVE